MKVESQTYDASRYWDRLHRQHSGKLSAVGYTALGAGFNRRAYVRRLEAAESILRRSASLPLGDVVEGGVGVGSYGNLWRALGASSWTGLDMSPNAINLLREEHPGSRFVCVDLGDADAMAAAGIADESATLVTAIDVLYHIVDDARFQAALANLGRKVRPGGQLLVSDIFVPERVQRADHVRRRPIEDYTRALAGCGLRLVDREPIFALLGDSIPRGPKHPADYAFFGGWRVIQKFLRVTPDPLRDPLGDVVARGIMPLERALARTGLTSGAGLELALFSRA